MNSNDYLDLRSPRSVEQLAHDCRAKLDNDAQEFPPRTVQVIPMTEAFLDLAERVLKLEERAHERTNNDHDWHTCDCSDCRNDRWEYRRAKGE